MASTSSQASAEGPFNDEVFDPEGNETQKGEERSLETSLRETEKKSKNNEDDKGGSG